MVWISSFGGFTANLILDPEQQVFDACAVSVHWPIISSVVLIVWNRMCQFFVLLIRKIPAPLQNATSAFWRKIKSLSIFKNPCFSMCHLLQKLNVLFCRIASFNIFIYLFIYFKPSELSSPMPLDSDMKKQEHLWQNRSPNFLAEKAFNAAVAALQPHCAICSLFCPYTKVQNQYL